MALNELTHKIIGAAMQVHKILGSGLLENAYEFCLAHELQKLNIPVERQKPIPLVYDGQKLECGFRADLFVDNRVIVECKSNETLHPVDISQVLSHLRLLNLQVRLLINFHVVVLKDGVKRIVNNYQDK